SLKGKFTYDSIADIALNCEKGVYGFMKDDINAANLTEIALKQEVHNGEAQILCTVEGDTPKLYSCTIKKCNSSYSPTQNLIVTVTDRELINATGGIVQGMSGSPILQDGKLIGALTHVLVSDSLTGYGIYAENMLDTAESVSQNAAIKQAS
ncbi:MAG: SpoIVB peptidase S55 domain-containing protein, partial [Acutalibacteraceae bacterium]